MVVNLNELPIEGDSERRSISATITKDPSCGLPEGSELKFISIQPQFTHQNDFVGLEDLRCFNGILLVLHFRENDGDEVDGSAVLVAPGVALCAKHVLEGRRDDGTSRIERVKKSQAGMLAYGFAEHGGMIWNVTHVTSQDTSDIAILGLELASALPPNSLFYQAVISTRVPSVGQRLWIAGFTAAQPSFEIGEKQNSNCSGDLLISQGAVSQVFPNGRDRVMCPFPCAIIDCNSWGGMSGGPVFDEAGHLVGILTASFSEKPSTISLLSPALIMPFRGGWPPRGHADEQKLLDCGSVGSFLKK